MLEEYNDQQLQLNIELEFYEKECLWENSERTKTNVMEEDTIDEQQHHHTEQTEDADNREEVEQQRDKELNVPETKQATTKVSTMVELW